MNETLNYRLVDVAQTLLASFPMGANTNTVIVTIYDVDDAATDVNGVAMTNINATDWKYSWTPTQTNLYLITYYNATLDVFYKEYVKVAGSLVGVPGGSGTGSTFAFLIDEFLKRIDNYNALDLDYSTANTSGNVAGICINNALQTIYSKLKASRYLEAYSSTALASVADQAYIELSGISDLDEIVAVKDTTNQWKLREIKPEQYFRSVPSPASVTGTPIEYCRIFNRIYLNPRPTSVITYTTEYRKNYANLASSSDTALIPSKYNSWIYSEAYVIWLMGEDINASGAIQVAQSERDRVEQIFLNDIFSNFDFVPQGRSHFLENDERRWLPYQNPIDGT